MTILRVLPAEEYPRLLSVADGICPKPEISRVLIAEQDGEIVGRTMLLAPAHIEGTWLREDRRNGSLGKRLLDRIEAEAKECGMSTLFAYAEIGTKTGDYLTRLGFTLCNFSVYQKLI